MVGPGEEVDIPYERGEKTEAVVRWVREIVRFSSFVDAGITPEPLATHLRRDYTGDEEAWPVAPGRRPRDASVPRTGRCGAAGPPPSLRGTGKGMGYGHVYPDDNRFSDAAGARPPSAPPTPPRSEAGSARGSAHSQHPSQHQGTEDVERWQGSQGQGGAAPEWHGWGWNESWYSNKGGMGKGGKGSMGGSGGKGGAASSGDPWAGYNQAEVLRAAANILESSWGRS